jgi:hypothetical protein
MTGCYRLYLSFMILMENVNFRVLPLGVLDGIAEFSALSWVLSV